MTNKLKLISITLSFIASASFSSASMNTPKQGDITRVKLTEIADYITDEIYCYFCDEVLQYDTQSEYHVLLEDIVKLNDLLLPKQVKEESSGFFGKFISGAKQAATFVANAIGGAGTADKAKIAIELLNTTVDFKFVDCEWFPSFKQENRALVAPVYYALEKYKQRIDNIPFISGNFDDVCSGSIYNLTIDLNELHVQTLKKKKQPAFKSIVNNFILPAYRFIEQQNIDETKKKAILEIPENLRKVMNIVNIRDLSTAIFDEVCNIVNANEIMINYDKKFKDIKEGSEYQKLTLERSNVFDQLYNETYPNAFGCLTDSLNISDDFRYFIYIFGYFKCQNLQFVGEDLNKFNKLLSDNLPLNMIELLEEGVF